MFWASSSFVERFRDSTGRYRYMVILSPRYGLLLDDFINPDASALGAKTLKRAVRLGVKSNHPDEG